MHCWFVDSLITRCLRFDFRLFTIWVSVFCSDLFSGLNLILFWTDDILFCSLMMYMFCFLCLAFVWIDWCLFYCLSCMYVVYNVNSTYLCFFIFCWLLLGFWVIFNCFVDFCLMCFSVGLLRFVVFWLICWFCLLLFGFCWYLFWYAIRDLYCVDGRFWCLVLGFILIDFGV